MCQMGRQEEVLPRVKKDHPSWDPLHKVLGLLLLAVSQQRLMRALAACLPPWHSTGTGVSRRVSVVPWHCHCGRGCSHPSCACAFLHAGKHTPSPQCPPPHTHPLSPCWCYQPPRRRKFDGHSNNFLFLRRSAGLSAPMMVLVLAIAELSDLCNFARQPLPTLAAAIREWTFGGGKFGL